MKTALVITCFNRPDYLRRCLLSVAASDLSGIDTVLLIDDASTDREARTIFDTFNLPGKTVEKYRYPTNTGIRHVMSFAYEKLFSEGFDYVINLDGDAIVQPDWIKYLLHLKKESPDHLVSGFNSVNKNKDGSLRNPLIKSYCTHEVKKYCNGINMLIDKKQYSGIKTRFLEPGNWDFNISSQFNTVMPRPSVIQHIGLSSSMGHGNDPDVSQDFAQIKLPNVTLFGIDAHDPAGIKRAAEISTAYVEFGEEKIIIERLFHGREGYSKFCIKDMVKYVNTSHVLIIHPDGYIVNPQAWDNDWLAYDYIGATWWYKDNMNVGNGGFSLRSKKLLDILAKMDIDHFHPEDDVICRLLRPTLEKKGIKFAPEDVANKFSIEAYNSNANHYSGQFGFHGYHVKGIPIPPITVRTVSEAATKTAISARVARQVYRPGVRVGVNKKR